MSNLLTKKEQKSVKTEYILRRLVVLLSFVSAISLMSLIFLFPSYILSYIRETEVSAQLNSLKQATKEANAGEDLTLRVSDAKRKIAVLKNSNKNPSVYELFRIFENKAKAIKLNEFTYNISEDGTPSIFIRGNASTREGLTEFSKIIKSQEEFLSVDLPISNFAKDRNIDFTMNIVVKK